MPDTYSIKRGATLPEISTTIERNGAAVDLTNASVAFRARKIGDPEYELSGTATIDDAANGKVSYALSETETQTAGIFNVEWTVTYGSGDIEVFPPESFDTLRIYRDLGEIV